MAAKTHVSEKATPVEKKGYSPPPVSQVQRPKPPPAGPRRRATERSQNRG